MQERPYFYGWNVVAVTLVMALFSWGLGFYGPSVYLATLQRLHGWSAATIATPVTVSRAVTRRSDGLRAAAMRAGRFWSVCGPFSLALTAQVGLITHLVALLVPSLGEAGTARAVSLTTIAAIVGRVGTGTVIDRYDPRLATSATLGVQIIGVTLLAITRSAGGLYAGALLFGLGVGNLVTLPSLILQREWPREHFATLISLSLAISQFTFAFGPAVIGVVRDWTGTYATALMCCVGLQALAAVWVALGPRQATR